jgi:diadenosine tetraphosphatase ApaH/serine/threonine PP2A family protein phosphatase
MCDLMWGDPTDDIPGWKLSERGAGYMFGTDAVEKFNRDNNMELIVRSH